VRRKLVLIAYSAVVVLALARAGAGQSSATALVDRKIDINLGSATFTQVLSVLTLQYRVPIGLERDVDYLNRIRNLMSFENGEINWKEGTLYIKSGTLKEILNSLVAQEPIYRWEVRDGVINVYPIQSRDPFLQKLLDTKVERFAPEKGMNKLQLHSAILDLPEIKALLEAEELETMRGVSGTGRSIDTDDEVKLGISHTNVRGVLNKWTRDSEYKLWVVDRIGDKRESLEISF